MQRKNAHVTTVGLEKFGRLLKNCGVVRTNNSVANLFSAMERTPFEASHVGAAVLSVQPIPGAIYTKQTDGLYVVQRVAKQRQQNAKRVKRE